VKRSLQLALLAAVAALFALAVACSSDEPATPAPTSVPVPTATTQSEPVVVSKVAEDTPVTAAPSSTDIFDENRFGGVLVWVPQGSVGNLDSTMSGSAIGRGVSWHFWESLMQWDQSGTLQPDMVEKWEINGAEYTFTLRDDLTWHDGTKVLPEDVEASIGRWRDFDKSFAPQVNKRWVSWETLDDKTFRITLTEPTGLLMMGLGYVGGVQPNIMPKETAAKYPSPELAQEFIASGPYKFISWDPGNEIILDRYEDYVPRREEPSYRAGAKLAYYDRMHMKEIPDQQTRVAAVLTGEVDFLDVISGDFLSEAQSASDKVSVHIGSPGAQPEIFFNMQSALIGDTPKGRLIRKAVRAALNAEEIMKGFGDPSLWSLCASMWFCGTLWESAGVDTEFYNMDNPELAKQLLDEAGYDGEPLKLVDAADFPTIHPIAVIARAQLEAAGFNIEYIATDWATQLQMLDDPTSYDLWPTWGSSNLYHPLVTAHLSVGDVTYNYPPDSETGKALLALKDEFAEVTSESDQLRIATEMSKLWQDNPSTTHFGQFFQLRVYDKDIMDVDIRGAPVGSPLFLNQWWNDAKRRADDPR
jgi:peptide/nickel transport system substrate-binding protein